MSEKAEMGKTLPGGWVTVKKHATYKLDPGKLPSVKTSNCPACGRPVTFIVTDGCVVPCEPQRRFIVFDGPYDAHGLPTEPVVAFTERRSRLVVGRAATKDEVELYRKTGSIGKSFTLGFEGHWTRGECPRLDDFMSGQVELPTVQQVRGE